MHILHFGKYYPPYRGGIETVVQKLCEGLTRRHLRVTALVSNDGPDSISEDINGVHVVRLSRQMQLASQPINLNALAYLKRIQFDIVHLHTPNPLGAVLTLLGGNGRPVVVSHHSDIVRQRRLGRFAIRAQRLLYKRAAALVVATPRHIEYSAELRGLEARCRVIHFPIDPQPYADAHPNGYELLPSEWHSRPLALFVGRLVYYKGIDVLLRAVARVPDVRLAIVGTGPLQLDLAALCQALQLDSRVKFLGEITEQRLLGLYRAARFLVLPSTAPSEAFGMVQLEAMAAGTAVISTNLRSGVPYVNQHGVTGLVVEPGDVHELELAITKLCQDPKLAAELGRLGRERVYRDFHIEHVLEQYVALYQSVGGKALR